MTAGFRDILRQAVRAGASEIRFEPHDGRPVVRFRIHGILHDATRQTPAVQDATLVELKRLSKMRTDEPLAEQEGMFRTMIAGDLCEGYARIAPTLDGEHAAIRLLTARPPSLDGLDFDPAQSARIRAALWKPHGMMMAAGPQGSGVTTTLRALLIARSAPHARLMSIEDTGEGDLPGVVQIRIGPADTLTSAAAIRAAMRQRPDAILIDDLRDEDALVAASEAADSCLVLVGVKADSAVAGLERLRAMSAHPDRLTSQVHCIIGVRLVRTPCPGCGRKGPFCAECLHTGYGGRIAAFEVVEPEALLAPRRAAAYHAKKSPPHVERSRAGHRDAEQLRRRRRSQSR